MVGDEVWGAIALKLAEVEFAFVGGEEQQAFLGEGL